MSLALRFAAQVDAGIGTITDLAAQPATLRRYVSQSGGTPWAGTGPTPTTVEQRIRVLALRPATIAEITDSGGRLVAGDQVALSQIRLSARDQLVIEGVTWQIVSEPREQWLAGARLVSVELHRQGA